MALHVGFPNRLACDRAARENGGRAALQEMPDMRFTDGLPYTVLLLLFLPFWLFDRLLKKRQKEQRGYGDDSNYSGLPF